MALLLAVAAVPAAGQARRVPARRVMVPLPAIKKGPAELKCPSLLGTGVSTKRSFCDVLTGRDPADGIIITLPPHKGPATLTFDLHNRHTYSEEQVRANKAYTKYTATVGVLTLDNTLISRAVVQTEFRKASDLVDRIGGGAGPGGVKAVAPAGTEPITVTIPEKLDNKTPVDQVTILGEKLAVQRFEEPTTYSSPGRPIAVVSKVMIEYQPPPVPVKKTRKK